MKRAFKRIILLLLITVVSIPAGATIETLLPSIKYYDEPPIGQNVNLTETDAIRFLDLGVGVSALLHTKDGKQILIDTGDDATAMPILRELSFLKAKQLDSVILTSPKPEHMGGFGVLTQSVPIQKILYPDLSRNEFKLDQYESAKLIPRVHLKPGKEYRLGDQIFLKVFHPKEPLRGADGEESLVAQLIYKGTKILFTGDISKDVSASLLNFPLESDILIVPNHAQFSSLDSEFLRKVNPRVAIISGVKKGKVTPSEDLMEQLYESWVDVYRTDRYGTITILLQPNSYDVIRP